MAAGNPIPEPLGARAETRRALGPQRKPLPKNIQKLFPSSFVFDEDMGWIPEGWDVKAINQELYGNWMKVPLAKGDVALTSEAPLGETYYLLTRFDYVLSQRLFAIRANNTNMTGCFLTQWLNSHLGQSALENRATGTTVTGIRQSELQKVELICPQFEIIQEFSNLTDPQLLRVAENEEQNLALSKLRDTLLPKLLSGELRIPDAEKLVEDGA